MEHKHTNQLIHETSPYLLQHADNPVAWHAWGSEALRLAKEQHKPIFLSIGYAACHWCHVMEHESFEDEEVAQLLNDHFISIKVDREERPDLDEIYMNATILYTRGHGGWPMSVWLTPEGKPFYAGTYFPPEDYYGRPGFKTVLRRLIELWNERGAEIAQDASKITEILRQMHRPMKTDILPREAVSMAVWQMAQSFDTKYGGVASGSNKFPPCMSLELFLREYRRNRNPELRAAVELTLEKMARGGIYDHLGGGFHRYSTDPQWLVPHFEKMLYDQALVSAIYLDGYQATGRKDFEETARGIFDYVLRRLQSAEGGFYSTEDADSEGMEGKFYIWTLKEVKQVLGEGDARLFAAYYDVTEQGNWNHAGDAHVPSGPKNILRILRSPEEIAKQLSMEASELEKRLAAARQQLFTTREKRPKPGLDDKILTAWNGLMISSLTKGSAVLHESKYQEAAARAARFLLDRMQKDGRLWRSYRNGKAHLMAYLDDYAFFIDGLIGLYEVSGELQWLDEAERLMETAIQYYWDGIGDDSGFFFTASDHEDLILRSKLIADNAVPSGNSVMIANLLRLEQLLGRRDFHEKAGAILSLFSGNAAQSPFGHERFLCGLEAWHEGFAEIAVIGPFGSLGTQQLLATVEKLYLPNKVIALLDPARAETARIAARVPLLAKKQMLDGKPTAYVCRDYACQHPTNNPAVLRQQLEHFSN
ncbi:MAG: thioredoxin domain-containing protein [Acidobacteria bacterium]|nr:thioredoxin domain-containing protein [Acidobacteriota bacterium]